MVLMHSSCDAQLVAFCDTDAMIIAINGSATHCSVFVVSSTSIQSTNASSKAPIGVVERVSVPQCCCRLPFHRGGICHDPLLQIHL